LKKEEFVSKLVEALQCYYSPIVMVGESINLTMLKTLSYLNGARIQLDDAKMKHLKTLSFIEERDDLCLGITVRLFLEKGTYIVVFGEPSKDTWYSKALVIHKHKVDAFPKADFKRPETH